MVAWCPVSRFGSCCGFLGDSCCGCPSGYGVVGFDLGLILTVVVTGVWIGLVGLVWWVVGYFVVFAIGLLGFVLCCFCFCFWFQWDFGGQRAVVAWWAWW